MATQAIPIRLENEEEAQVVRQLYRMLIHDGTAALVGPDNSKIALPPTIYKVLVAIMKDMQEGKSIGLIPVMEELSTQAAADMLGVSRQFLVNELEAGKLAFHRTGTHRKMYLKDLLAYQEQRGMNRKDAIRRIARHLMNSAFTTNLFRSMSNQELRFSDCHRRQCIDAGRCPRHVAQARGTASVFVQMVRGHYCGGPSQSRPRLLSRL